MAVIACRTHPGGRNGLPTVNRFVRQQEMTTYPTLHVPGANQCSLERLHSSRASWRRQGLTRTALKSAGLFETPRPTVTI